MKEKKSNQPIKKRKKRSSTGLINMTHLARMINLSYTEQQYLHRTVYSNQDSSLTQDQFKAIKSTLKTEITRLLTRIKPKPQKDIK